MSQSTKNQLSWFEDLSSYLRGTAVSGVCGQESNLDTWHDAFLLWSAVYFDICDCSTGVRQGQMDLLRILYARGEKTLTTMKSLLMRLRVYSPYRTGRYRSFKRSLLHRVKGSIELLDLLDPILYRFWSAPCGDTFRPLNDVLSFMSRLTLQSEGLEQLAIEKFRKADDICVTAGPEDIDAVADLIEGWLKDFRPVLEFGLHGPGASAGLTRLESTPDAKYSRLFHTQLLAYAGCPVDNYPHLDSYPDAEIVFVPKSFDSVRTICKVPAGLMFWQQTVQKQLYAFIEHSPLRKHVCFSRQDYSRNMARKGSRDDSYYTIDLSSASDTVSWAVVKRAFRRTSLLRILYATRSRSYRLPDGTTLVPKKFDPMGSALTFPVETLLFAAICESTSRVKNPRYRVYGDDIVCHPADIDADELIARLTRFGFIVNESKTYTTGPFREACGIECYNGEDVSPLRLSRAFRYLKPKNPDDLARLRELANAFCWRGYKFARLIVLGEVLKKEIPPFTLTGANDTWVSFMPTNYRLRTRYNKALQRSEFPVMQLLRKRSRGRECNAYYTWCSTVFHSRVLLPLLCEEEWSEHILQGSSGGGRLHERRSVVWRPTDVLR